MKYANIIIDINNKNVDRAFQYAVPEELREAVAVGMRVNVPFGKGNKRREGYIISFGDKAEIAEDKIKPIISIADKYPVFSEERIKLAVWMREKYYSTLSACLQCIMPRITKDKTEKYVWLNGKNENYAAGEKEVLKKNGLQARVIELLKNDDGLSISEIKNILGITLQPIRALEKKKLIIIKAREVKRDVINTEKYSRTKPFVPTEEQKKAIDFIKERLGRRDSLPILIRGVTGSGKTEIYMRIIEEIILRGEQAIMLVPEISLTPQTVERFTGRFGKAVSFTHSKMTDEERFDQWKKAREGEISIMIGPRSAVFTPFEKLGIIIIDEEHESSYKSDTSPKYSAKEIAVKLKEITGCQVVLGSATPDIGSYYKAKKGDYELITLENRVNHCFPTVEITDMREELAKGNRSVFSEALFNGIKENLKRKKQSILFLNRRGHSTFVSCRKCGYVMMCDNCNVNYTYHLSTDKLVCHYCSKTEAVPEKCPQCGLPYIKYFGAGTQKIEEAAKKYFPEARILRMDMDTTGKKHSHENILEEFKNGNADILIGTQMIAKGLDFPNVTLVGVIAADLTLNMGDFRCAETSFQLLTQVAGRAGRADNEGKVFIQTYQPEHYSITLAQKNDYEEFYKKEIEIRRIQLYPPFSHIFFIMFSGEDEKKIIMALNALMDIMKYYNKKTNFDLLGPAPAILSKIKRQYRWKIIVKGCEEERIRNFVIYCVEKMKEKNDLSGITVSLTLNPTYIQ